jgi:hypothetical protein
MALTENRDVFYFQIFFFKKIGTLSKIRKMNISPRQFFEKQDDSEKSGTVASPGCISLETGEFRLSDDRISYMYQKFVHFTFSTKNQTLLAIFTQ